MHLTKTWATRLPQRPQTLYRAPWIRITDWQSLYSYNRHDDQLSKATCTSNATLYYGGFILRVYTDPSSLDQLLHANPQLSDSALEMGYLPPRGPKGRRRDMAKPISTHQFVYDLIMAWVAPALGQGPSIFVKSPQELDFDAVKARNKMNYAMKHFPKREPTPPGYVRVHFFMSLELLQQIEQRPNLIALVPLEPGGELDLRRVRDVWGLDTCAPIDPLRWTVFGTTSDHLSPLAIHTLSERHAAINFIEPSVSDSARRKRAMRAAVIPWWRWTRNIYHINRFRVEELIQQHTNLFIWHQEAARWRRHVAWRAERWMSEHDELLRMLLALLILAVILFVVSVMGGYIDLGLRNRAMIWMTVGTRMVTVLP